MFTAKKGAAAAMAIALLLCAGLVWGADQARDRLHDGTGDGTPDVHQLRDGSCQTDTAAAAGQVVQPKGDADRLRDGSGDGAPDQVRDQAQDGSCQA
jgi:hypothetical protein